MKKIIVLSKKHGKQEIIVDDDNFEWLNSYTWTIYKKRTDRTLYAKSNGPRDPITRKQTAKIMHRLILGISDPKIKADHIDHNGLNNQRNNLRSCSNAQNGQNRQKNSIATSRFIGVCWNKKLNKWNAFIQKKENDKKKSINLGNYKTEEEAAIVRDKKAVELFGEFANLNFK